MALTFPLGVIGLVSLVAPAWAGDFSAELDFLTRASNSNLFALEESRLTLDRSGGSQVKTFARRMVDEHGRAETELKPRPRDLGRRFQRRSMRSIRRTSRRCGARPPRTSTRPMSPIRGKTTPTPSLSLSRRRSSRRPGPRRRLTGDALRQGLRIKPLASVFAQRYAQLNLGFIQTCQGASTSPATPSSRTTTRSPEPTD
jgi:hypothetical protein